MLVTRVQIATGPPTPVPIMGFRGVGADAPQDGLFFLHGNHCNLEELISEVAVRLNKTIHILLSLNGAINRGSVAGHTSGKLSQGTSDLLCDGLGLPIVRGGGI